MKSFRYLFFVAGAAALLSSCMKESSTATGWDYNNPINGGFEKALFDQQEPGPGLVFIEGGTFTMGRAEQDVMYDWNNRAARVTVSSFYMDQNEVTNFHWLEYLYWINRTYNTDYPMVYQNALPDTLCWRTPLGFHEKYVEYYLRHPAYRDYPVVGVSWLQANDYCSWRTDRVNEQLLVAEGVLMHGGRDYSDQFNTERYLAGESATESIFNDLTDYGQDKKKLKEVSKDPKKWRAFHHGQLDQGTFDYQSGELKPIHMRRIRMEDGLLLPRYRLPTEAEWEFAASGLIGNLEDGTENVDARRFYPWDGHWVRDENDQFKGAILANFVRGHGDYMGVAGALNDGADVTAPVDSYWPNDYGLYNMAGNVSEWVLDVYRPLSSEDFDEFRPFRGNVFTNKQKVFDGETFKYEVTNSDGVSYDVHGMKEYLNEFERVRYQRISGEEHKTYGKTQYTSANDTDRIEGLQAKIASKNPLSKGTTPDEYFLSHDLKKDTIELGLIRVLNDYIDAAISFKNDKQFIECDNKVKSMFDLLKVDAGKLWVAKGIIGSEKDFKSYKSDAVAMILSGLDEYVSDTPGKLRYRNVTEEENLTRLNYRKDDYIDYKDGDIESSTYYDNQSKISDLNSGIRDEELIMYQSQHENYNLIGDSIAGRSGWPTTMISDKSRVYKGGSWADRAYWLNVGNRRYLDERLSMATLGFRCCMDRVGSPHGNNYQGGSGNAFLGIGRRKK